MDPQAIRILLIDDDQGDYLMTRAMLDQSRQLRASLDWVPTFEEAVDALERNEHDVYLVDYFLEDHTGLDVVREARSRRVRAPLIMLTGRGNRQVDLDAMKAGASDYLVKGRIDPDILERSIRYALERRRAQEALRDSEERHRGMFDHLPIGLYRTSPEGDFMDANPALVRILGYPDPATLQEAYSRNLYVNPAERDRFRETLEKYGVARGFETHLRREDGTTVRVRNTARAHRAADGRILYFEGAVEDVTDAQEAEEVRGGAERFRVVFEASALPILLLDLEGVVLQVNPAFARTFDYGVNGLQGRSWAEVAVEGDRRAVRSEVRALASGDQERVVSNRRLRGGDGSVLWARSLCTAIRDPNGVPDHLMVVLEDVAEAPEG